VLFDRSSAARISVTYRENEEALSGSEAVIARPPMRGRLREMQ
jgi:hypothetical protein